MGKCGKSCLTNVTANYYYHCESTGQCIRRDKQCNGTCPEGRPKCGDNVCLCSDDDPVVYCEQWYTIERHRDCNGTCIGKDAPCNDTCVEGYVLCNDRCVTQEFFDTNFYTCDGECISKGR